jgi:hypothetical protein
MPKGGNRKIEKNRKSPERDFLSGLFCGLFLGGCLE